MVAGCIFSKCFGCSCTNWGLSCMDSCAFLINTACEGKSPDCDPGLPHVTVGTSVLWQQDIPILVYLWSCDVPTPPCSDMAQSSLTMRLCTTVLQEPHWGWLQGSTQKIWERSLGIGTDPSLTHVPLCPYLKLTWHTELAQTRMTGNDNDTLNALLITVGRNFIRITNYSLWKAVCCMGQHVQN